jgi:protein phosphatase
MIDAGLADPESYAAISRRHVLTNYVGAGNVAVDVEHFRLADGDRLLLCTDGLTDLVSEMQIAALLEVHSRPEDACRALVDRALDSGGRDNVTVVLASYTIPKLADHADRPARPG